jgi:hypothetical protein
MNAQESIISQFQSALEMLKQTIAKCPDDLWNSPDDKARFWHIAYHALFFTHLYLQESGGTFKVWDKHRSDYENIGKGQPGGEPYDREDVLEYLAFCQKQVTQRLSQVDLDAPSGFSWLPFNKLELQIYNIRHLQQHTGELMERVGTRAGVEIQWVSRQHK